MLEYTGIIKQVRFYSEDTKFIVCVIDSEQEDKPILATGYMSYVNPQDKYHFQGEYTIHPKYGKQFQIQSYEIILADDESEIIRYLSSPRELVKNKQLLLLIHWEKMHSIKLKKINMF